MTLDSLTLSSISGIVTITGVAVEILKRYISNVKYLKDVPVWIYSVVIAAALSIVANKVLKTADGVPFLPGNIWHVMWSALASAAGASGFYTWIRNPEPVATASTLLSPKIDNVDLPS